MKRDIQLVLRVILVVLALLLFGYQVYQADQARRDNLTDDAYISLRYAANLATGNGPIWQPNERVEGYTNFLLVAISALFMRLGSAGEAIVRWIGIIAGVGVLLLIVVLPRQLQSMCEAKMWPTGLGAICVGSSFYFAFWSNSGLETSLFIFLCLLAFLLTLRSLTQPGKLWLAAVTGISFAGAALTRPDGLILFVSILIVWVVYGLLASHSERLANLRALALIVSVFFLIYGTYFAWRLTYYGQLLPNTFYVKVGTSLDQIVRGMTYAQNMLTTLGILPLILTAVLAPIRQPKNAAELPDTTVKTTPSVIWTLLMFAVAYSVYIICVGGDNFGPRLALIVFVVFAVLADVGLSRFVHTLQATGRFGPHFSKGVFAAASFMIIVIAHPWAPPLSDSGVRDARQQANWKQLGLWLAENANAGDWIAVDAAGAIPYFSQLRAIDVLGLNDLHISHLAMPTMGQGKPGHEKFDPQYVFSRNPDWIATWIDQYGHPANFGLYRWPEIQNYRPYLVVQTADQSRSGMREIGSDYDYSRGWDEGYQYALWQKWPTVKIPSYTELPLLQADIVQRNGYWEMNWRLPGGNNNDYLFSAMPGDSLSFTVRGGSRLAIVTICHAWSGILKASIGHDTYPIDLYSPFHNTQCVHELQIPETGNGQISVELVIDSQRNPASQSTQVFINRILQIDQSTP